MASRVYIFWSHQLFYEAVQMLMQSPDVQIVGASSDLDIVQGELDELRPDVVLIEEPDGEPSADVETLRILESSAWDPRIVRLSLEDNDLIVYHREHRTIDRAADLLRLIQEI